MFFFVMSFGLFVFFTHLLYVNKFQKRKLSKAKIIELFILYFIVFNIGLGNLIAFTYHVFFSEIAAAKIGWATSPFQIEVGIHDGAWGVLAILCIWFRKEFWFATGIGWSIFMLGAGIGHLVQTVKHDNYAPYNFFMIFNDIGVAVIIPILLVLYYKYVLKNKTTM
jgi:hypothetical protein